MARVLIAEDHPTVRMLISELVTNSGHEVVSEVGNGLEALHSYFVTKPDLMIVDYQMPCMDGISLIEEVLKIDSGVKVMVCSAAIDQKEIRSRINKNIPVVTKPFDNDKFVTSMLFALMG
ncbi:response regulator [Brevibacillus massiliensis]|uniref:response regulator n=1 Tax=Brevibacillus massiliensis TaxID=1118054 RepID=UPI00037B943F|nr:response regulator [Brevibacillus massiliensis]